MHFQHPASHVPAADVKSRKETYGQMHTMAASAAGHPAALKNYEQPEMRRVSQQMIVPSGSSLPVATVEAGRAGLDSTNQSCAAGKCATERGGDEMTTRVISDKSMKRNRNFTPASSRVIDDEDEPRRASPRIRMTPFVEDDVICSVT